MLGELNKRAISIEVRGAVNEMKSGTAPGLDRLSGAFKPSVSQKVLWQC